MEASIVPNNPPDCFLMVLPQFALLIAGQTKSALSVYLSTDVYCQSVFEFYLGE